MKFLLIAVSSVLIAHGSIIKQWEFNGTGDSEGWVGNGAVNNMTVTGGCLVATAVTTDPALLNTADRTGNIEMPTEGFTTVQFRVRETSSSTGNYLTSFSETGLYASFGGVVYAANGARLVSAVDDGDNFFIVTWEFDDVTADPALFARWDPIGGPDAANNTFEIDWIRVYGLDPGYADSFSDGVQGDWAHRYVSTSSADFSGGNAELNIATNNGQPNAIYHEFDSLTLADGETVRLCVDVFSTKTTAASQDIRLGLGFANNTISGTSSQLAVPLSGYVISIPSGGGTAGVNVRFVEDSGIDPNFFNAGSRYTLIGTLGNTSSQSVSDIPKTLVIDLTRFGNNLVFSGNMERSDFSGEVVASGTNILSNFTFNTVGLAYAFAQGETAGYDTLSVEKIKKFTVDEYYQQSDGEDWGPAVRRAVADAEAYTDAGAYTRAKIVFTNDLYYLNSREDCWGVIDLFSAKRLIIDGQNAELLCAPENRHFAVWDSNDIVIKNLRLDYYLRVATQGAINALNFQDRYFSFTVENGYDRPVTGSYPDSTDGTVVFTDSSGKHLHLWGRLNAVWQPVGFPTNKFRANFTTAFDSTLDELAAGDRIALKLFYDFNETGRNVFAADGEYKTAGNGNIEVRSSEQVLLENITSYGAPRFTVYNQKSPFTVLDNVNVVQKPGTTRLIASNKDGFHCKSSTTPPVIQNCTLERTADDCINVSDMPDVITQKSGTLYTASSTANVLNPSALSENDTVLVVDPASGCKVGEAVVTNRTMVNYRVGSFELTDIVYETGYSSIDVGDYLYAQRRSSAIIENTVFNTTLKKGIVLGGPGIVRNCVFNDTNYGINPRFVISDKEGPYLYGFVAESNVFNNVETAGIVSFAGGLLNLNGGNIIRSNRFNQEVAGHGVSLTHVNGLQVENNHFDFDASVPVSWEAIDLDGCSNITVSGNTGDRL